MSGDAPATAAAELTPEERLHSRREFFRRLLVLRYAAPLIASYPLSALAQAGPSPPPALCCDTHLPPGPGGLCDDQSPPAC